MLHPRRTGPAATVRVASLNVRQLATRGDATEGRECRGSSGPQSIRVNVFPYVPSDDARREEASRAETCRTASGDDALEERMSPLGIDLIVAPERAPRGG